MNPSQLTPSTDYVSIDGQKIHFQTAGKGPPLLLVHGLLGGSFCWRSNMAALAATHTVVAVDLPGNGYLDCPSALDCSMHAQVERLLELCDHLKLGPVDVVGSSWGGGISFLLASASSLVRSLVLVAPVNPWSEFGRGRIRFLGSRLGALVLRASYPFSRPMHGVALRRMYGDPARIPPGTLQGYSRLVRPGRAHNLLNILRAWPKDMQSVRDAIPQVRVPTLLIWGTEDRAVDVHSAKVLQQMIPGSSLALLPGAGHLPFEETPEEFNRLVLQFLAEKTPAVSH